jgi:hypothetical protein
MTGEALLKTPEHALTDFKGTYTGVSPTDESAVGVGELTIIIDEAGLTSKMATGLGLVEDSGPLTDTRELAPAEIGEIFGSDEWAGKIRAFDVGNLMYMFYIGAEEPHAPRLSIVGGMGDILGPTILFTSAQVEQGLHEKLIADIEQEMGLPGATPRLSNQGVVSTQ